MSFFTENAKDSGRRRSRGRSGLAQIVAPFQLSLADRMLLIARSWSTPEANSAYRRPENKPL
eukprot:694086-Pyramimonas_sp.AAC.1